MCFDKTLPQLIFVPHSFHKTDELANDFVWLDNLKKQLEIECNTEIKICANMKESYEVYTEKKVDFIFAQRLHSIILSQVYSIPFL